MSDLHNNSRQTDPGPILDNNSVHHTTLHGNLLLALRDRFCTQSAFHVQDHEKM